MSTSSNSPYQRYCKPNWWERNWQEILVVFIGIIAINVIFIPKAFRVNDVVDTTSAGQLGDFVGGYVGTILTLISVVLIYSTFKQQRHSNIVEKFQNRFFELLKMHRDNVSEISIGNDSGRKIFVMLLREFREILEVAKQLSMSQNKGYSNEQLFVVSYYGLFFGVGPNSSRILKEELEDFDSKFVEDFEKKLNNAEYKEKIKAKRKFNYTPFEGHQSRLGHYYRHLYQTVCFVDKQDESVDIDKYSYVKTIRAQLTTHEQALFFVNSRTPIGLSWWDDDKLITRYRLVKNVPATFFNKEGEIDITAFFPKDYFENADRKRVEIK